MDADGGVSTATDECLINYVRTFGTNARTVAIDKNNNLWVGGLGNQWHEEIDGVTGQHVPGSEFNPGCGGYGGFIDSRGVLAAATSAKSPHSSPTSRRAQSGARRARGCDGNAPGKSTA